MKPEQTIGGIRLDRLTVVTSIVLLVISLPVAHIIAKQLTNAGYYGITMNEEFPDFVGLDGNGEQISRLDFKGQLHLVFMGNTRCNSICYPRILLFREISEVFDDHYPSLKKRVEFNFFTIDPKNDRPGIMKAYFDDYMRFSKSVIVDDKAFFHSLSLTLGARFTYKGHGQFEHADYLYLIDENYKVRLMYGGRRLDAARIAHDIHKITMNK